jgi:Uma2 family endonuclease
MTTEAVPTEYQVDTSLELVPTRHKITVHLLQQMAELGLFQDNQRVELLDGEMFIMSPVGAYHSAVVDRLADLLRDALRPNFLIRVQGPIQLNETTQPQPDIAVLNRREDYYAETLPGPSDVLVVVEVADSTRTFDRTEKLLRYAQANIAEYWIVDVRGKMVEQYTQPREDRYRIIQYHTVGETLTATSIADLTLAVNAIFGNT